MGNGMKCSKKVNDAFNSPVRNTVLILKHLVVLCGLALSTYQIIILYVAITWQYFSEYLWEYESLFGYVISLV